MRLVKGALCGVTVAGRRAGHVGEVEGGHVTAVQMQRGHVSRHGDGDTWPHAHRAGATDGSAELLNSRDLQRK